MCFYLGQGSAGQKRSVFYVLKKTYFKISFLYKKKLCDRFYFKDDTKFLFSFFEKINILNKLKQNLVCGPRAAVCRPLI